MSTIVQRVAAVCTLIVGLSPTVSQPTHAAAAASVATPSTMAAAVAPETFQDVATLLCLDSNANQAVYTNPAPCGRSNNFQQWTPITNGSYRLLRNVATLLCLDSNANQAVYTNPCSTGNPYQNWL